jgi:hypothetical protein
VNTSENSKATIGKHEIKKNAKMAKNCNNSIYRFITKKKCVHSSILIVKIWSFDKKA